MRGKVKQDGSTLCRCRITPAYAGKRLRRQAPRCQSEDHPRLCGEKPPFHLLMSIPTGSPPPMRGKGYTTAAESEENRITPAYAGKRWEGLKMAQDFEDHPRLCGEKFVQHLQCYLYTGSPPPMRGKAPARAHRRALDRITPAYAGKSPAPRFL